MGLQTAVYQTPPLNEVGGLATTEYVNPVSVVPGCRVNGAANVGGFVWSATAPSGTNANPMEQFVTNSAVSGKPLGFVYRVQDVALPCASGYTLAIPQGQACPVAAKGRFFAVSATAVTAGQKVYAVLADGSIKTDATGQTISGAVETDWVAKTSAAIGGLFELELI
jgi:hypothetical protein